MHDIRCDDVGRRCGRRGLAVAFFAGLLVTLSPAQETAGKADEDQKKAAPARAESFPGVKEAGQLPRAVEPERVSAKPVVLRSTVVEATREVTLRYLRNATSDPVAGPLPKGTLLLQTDPTSYGFVPVALPGGFEGFVHRSYLEVGADGYGTTKGTRVSFRHRPRTGEPPLFLIEESGERLPVLGLEGDWYRVLSNDAVAAWAPADAVRAVQPVGDAVRKRLGEQITKFRAPFAAKRAAVADAAAREAKLAALARRAADARIAFEAEMAKGDVLQEDLAAVGKLVESLQADVAKLEAAGAPVGARIAALAKDVDRRRSYQEARRFLVEAEARKSEAVEPRDATEKRRHPRRRFQVVGWLEYRPGPGDYSEFRVSKGGRLLFYVTCSSGRYDLQDFVGREVGLRGRIDRPQGADVRVVDINRLVVLSGRR